MSKYVVSVSISSVNSSKFSANVNIYDVTSIGKRVNATLRSYNDDFKKRFDLNSFNKLFIESDLTSCRASIKFLVDDISDVEVSEVVKDLKKSMLEKMKIQLVAFENYIENLFYQEEYKTVKF